MFVYGLLAGALLMIAALLLTRRAVAAWERFWSLDRLWCRLERNKGSVKVAKRRFMKLADGCNHAEIETAANRLIRDLIVECSFAGRIIPLEDITLDDLDRRVDSNALIKVVDRALPSGHTAHHCVKFVRVMTPRFVKDVDELRVYYDDPRVLFRMLGNALARELDTKFIAVVNKLLHGVGEVVPSSRACQWFELDDAITRSSIAEAFRLFTHLGKSAAPDTVLINTNTLRGILAFSRRDDSEEVKPGVCDNLIEKGVRWVITDKCDLVPDGAMYMFGLHEKLGRSFRLDRARLHFDRHAYDLQFFAHMMLGSIIYAGVNIVRVDFVRSKSVEQVAETETAGSAG